jgi:hypothetical protein
VYNWASLTPYGGSTSFPDPTESTNSTSIALHGTRKITRTVPVAGLTQAQSLADQLVAYYKDAIPRITSITVNGLAQVSALWTAILNLEISDPIRIRRRPYPVPSATPVRDYFIEGYAVEITLDPPSWQVRYDVSPAIDGYHGPLIGGTGVAFPTSPATDDTFYRTDLDLLCFYNGSSWLTVQEYMLPLAGETLTPISTSGAVIGRVAMRTDYNVVYTRLATTYNVQTTNNGSNFWTFAINTFDGAVVALSAPTTAAATAGTWTHVESTPAATVYSPMMVYASVTKTGAPGSIYAHVTVFYRLKVT